MNPQTNGAPELNLPPPIVAEASTFDPNTVPAAAYETASAPAATAAVGNPLMPAMTLPVPSAPLPLIAQGSVVNTASNANPAVADDVALGEGAGSRGGAGSDRNGADSRASPRPRAHRSGSTSRTRRSGRSRSGSFAGDLFVGRRPGNDLVHQ